jgi:diketogulonate reductase-like aldo/keto reductase
MAAVPVLELNDGNKIPAVSYGLGTVHFMGQENDISNVTVKALQAGFHHLDCAEAYMNEAGVGAGIKAAGLPREKLYISTKVVGTKDQDVAAALNSSLEKLGLDYVDLYLVHLPFSAGSGAGLQKIWSQMEALKQSGKAKSIGVSNFEKDDLEIVLETATVTPAVNQIEFHPYLQHTELLEFHRQRGIATAGYSTMSAITAARPGPVDSIYAELAQKYGVSENDIALRWVLDQGIVAVVTSNSSERLQGYLKAAQDFQLSAEEVQQISELGKQKHHQGPTLQLMGGAYGNYKLA